MGTPITPNGIWKMVNAMENAASEPTARFEVSVVATMKVSWLAARPIARGAMRRSAWRASTSWRSTIRR
jgi:hypothetical protein